MRSGAGSTHEFGDLAVAADCFNRSAELAASDGDWPSWTRHTLNRADALAYLGRFHDADSLLARALQVCEEQNMDFGLAEVLTDRAMLELDRGQHGAAVTGFRKVLSLARRVESAVAIHECINGLSNALCRLDSNKECKSWRYYPAIPY